MAHLSCFASVVCALCLGACQWGPPPVGRAANPSQESSPHGDAQALEVGKKIELLQKKIQEQPKDRSAHVELGKAYYEAERFVDAALVFRQALDAEPEDAEVLKLMGVSLFFLGNADDAIRMNEHALQLSPKDIDALFFVGAILLDSRPQDKDALKRVDEVWSKFVELAPDHPRKAEIVNRLDMVHKAMRGEMVLGGEEKKRGNPHGQGGAPQGSDGPANGGPGSFKKGTRVPALAANAKPLDRKRAEALDALDEGRFFDARQAAQAVLEAKPLDDEMGVARARAMVQMGEAPAAIKAFAEVIKRNPRLSPAYHYLGMAYMMAGDGAHAAQTWRNLMAMDPDYAAKNRLEQRAQMAERMAGGGQ